MGKPVCRLMSITLVVMVCLFCFFTSKVAVAQHSPQAREVVLRWPNVRLAQTYKMEQRLNDVWTDIARVTAHESGINRLSVILEPGTHSFRVVGCVTDPAGVELCEEAAEYSEVLDVVLTEIFLDTPVLTIEGGETQGGFALGWSVVPNASQYEVQEWTDNTTWTPLPLVMDDNELAFNGRQPGQYRFRVQAQTPFGLTSGWSVAKSVSVAFEAGQCLVPDA